MTTSLPRLTLAIALTVLLVDTAAAHPHAAQAAQAGAQAAAPPAQPAQPAAAQPQPAADPTDSSSSVRPADDRRRWLLQTSVLTQHFRNDDSLNNYQWMLDVEFWRSPKWAYGVALFSNSFSQPCQYLYVARAWTPIKSAPQLFLKLTGGVLHGYEGEHREEIPFNGSGVAIVLVPSAGYHKGRFSTEIVLFGLSGVMVNAGVYF